MVDVKDIKSYWNRKQPGRKIAGDINENNNPKKFFELIDSYRFHRNNYEYLISGDFFNYSDYREKKILEIGCGLGADLQKFAESGSKVYAIDAAESSFNTLKKRFDLINKKKTDIVLGTTKYLANNNKEKIIRASTFGSSSIITIPGSLLKRNVFQKCGYSNLDPPGTAQSHPNKSTPQRE